MSMAMPAVTEPHRPRGGRGRKLAVVGGFIVILAALAVVFSGQLESNIVYFRTPRELLTMGTTAYDRPVRLGGQVVPGSVQWNPERLDLRFRVTDGTGSEITVHSKGAPPQMFRDGMGVVVEGRYGRGGVFESSNLMVKHSNEYRAPKQGEAPTGASRSLIKERGT